MRSTILLCLFLFVGCNAAPATTDSSKNPKSQSEKESSLTAPTDAATTDAADSTTQTTTTEAAMKPTYNQLTPEEERVIIHKGTEWRGTGDLIDNKLEGTYVCRQCNARLYTSEHKFESNCGWPSFDDEIEGAVRRETDADGRRVEILCMNCDGHLGHVFLGEGFTSKNTRHCVNSVSMKFYRTDQEIPATIKN